MDDPPAPSRLPRRLRGTLGGDGRPGPIEERIGRRLVRLVEPDSDEGRRLIREARIDWIGPDGEHLGHLDPDQAFRRLRARLERRLAHDPVQLDAALTALRGWALRLGRLDH